MNSFVIYLFWCGRFATISHNCDTYSKSFAIYSDVPGFVHNATAATAWNAVCPLEFYLLRDFNSKFRQNINKSCKVSSINNKAYAAIQLRRQQLVFSCTGCCINEWPQQEPSIHECSCKRLTKSFVMEANSQCICISRIENPGLIVSCSLIYSVYWQSNYLNRINKQERLNFPLNKSE